MPPSKATISRILSKDLGYSYKNKFSNSKSLTENAQQKLDRYLDIVRSYDAQKMYFFDESSVIKTTGYRLYGHAPINHPTIEVPLYASKENFSVNLLHGYFGVAYVNVLPDLSNGLE